MTFQEKTCKLINDKTKIDQLNRYVQLLEQTNQQFNLTKFANDKLWEEGIYESLLSLQSINAKSKIKVLDIGAGAGFPSIPYKIANPQIELYIYEPMQKRANFLQTISDELNLNCHISHIRAENAKQHDFFDYICARAVAPLHILIEITHHLAKVGGHFIFIKGPKYHVEIARAQQIIDELKINITVSKVIIKNKEIFIVSYQKTSPTPPHYPRQWKDIQAEQKS